MQLLGVYDEKLVEPLAKCSAIWVSTGDWWSAATTDWMKLPSPDRPTCVEIRFGELTMYEITPEQFGFSPLQLTGLVGGNPEEKCTDYQRYPDREAHRTENAISSSSTRL